MESSESIFFNVYMLLCAALTETYSRDQWAPSVTGSKLPEGGMYFSALRYPKGNGSREVVGKAIADDPLAALAECARSWLMVQPLNKHTELRARLVHL